MVGREGKRQADSVDQQGEHGDDTFKHEVGSPERWVNACSLPSRRSTRLLVGLPLGLGGDHDAGQVNHPAPPLGRFSGLSDSAARVIRLA